LDWKLAQRFRHADDHARGQTFLEIYAIKHDAYMIEDVKQRFDSLIANPKRGREDWWWCDALFMAPPVLAKLSAATGDAKYIQYMNTMFWDTHEYLYDKQENLFYRDESYFKKLTPAGRKTFWARGNGWVMAGIVRILQSLPKNDPYYEKYVALLKSMAVAVKKNQYADGLWRPSLLDENEIPHPETSASSFFCYTLAWSIRNGILDRKEFMPVVERAWTGLTQHVTPDGKLEWVQPIGASPEKVVRDNFQEYGAGAFLLAGSELFILR
jgi:rhamnogalacturonyl hydrolase YesR